MKGRFATKKKHTGGWKRPHHLVALDRINHLSEEHQNP
jgi:hypothetical protein